MNAYRYILGISVLGIVCVGCEINQGGSSCGDTEGCGGDVLGTWTAEEVCMNTAAIPDNVLGPAACAGSLSNMLANTDMTYTISDTHVVVTGRITTSAILRVTEACAQALGAAGLDEDVCDAISEQVADAFADDDAFLSSEVTCVAPPGSCTCEILTRADASETFAYERSATNLIRNDNREAVGYCVEEDLLRLHGDANNPIRTIVFRRRASGG